MTTDERAKYLDEIKLPSRLLWEYLNTIPKQTPAPEPRGPLQKAITQLVKKVDLIRGSEILDRIQKQQEHPLDVAEVITALVVLSGVEIVHGSRATDYLDQWYSFNYCHYPEYERAVYRAILASLHESPYQPNYLIWEQANNYLSHEGLFLRDELTIAYLHQMQRRKLIVGKWIEYKDKPRRLWRLTRRGNLLLLWLDIRFWLGCG